MYFFFFVYFFFFFVVVIINPFTGDPYPDPLREKAYRQARMSYLGVGGADENDNRERFRQYSLYKEVSYIGANGNRDMQPSKSDDEVYTDC